MGIVKTLAGSLPKPAGLVRARWKHSQGDGTSEGVATAARDAMVSAFEIQSKLNFANPVDGQFGRGDLIDFFTDQLSGCEPAGLVRCVGNRYHRRPRIVGPLARTQPIVLPEWQRACKEATHHGFEGTDVRAVLTGPYTLTRWCYDEHYDSEQACASVFAKIVVAEIADLVAAGAREIQIDEPALTGHEPDWVDGLLQSCVDAAADARVWLACGFCAPDSNLARIWNWPGRVLVLDVAGAGAERVGRLPKLGAGRILAAGITDGTSADLETDSVLRTRLEALRAAVPSEQLWLTPGAGLHALSPEQSLAHLECVAELAGR